MDAGLQDPPEAVSTMLDRFAPSTSAAASQGNVAAASTPDVEPAMAGRRRRCVERAEARLPLSEQLEDRPGHRQEGRLAVGNLLPRDGPLAAAVRILIEQRERRRVVMPAAQVIPAAVRRRDVRLTRGEARLVVVE